MEKLFKSLKVLLIALIGIAILNDIGAYLYVVIVGHDSSDFPYMITEVLAYLLSGYLVFKNKIFGNVLVCILALLSIQTALQLDRALFAWGLLKFAPQVVFRNTLMLALLIISIAHFITFILRTRQSKANFTKG